jgi:hypothetical protein
MVKPHGRECPINGSIRPTNDITGMIRESPEIGPALQLILHMCEQILRFGRYNPDRDTTNLLDYGFQPAPGADGKTYYRYSAQTAEVKTYR